MNGYNIKSEVTYTHMHKGKSEKEKAGRQSYT